MQNLEVELDKAEYWLQLACQRPMMLKTGSGSSKWKSIHQKLADIFVEESTKEPALKSLYHSSHLLDKLIAREKLNCLIVNLYPGNEGYSLVLKNRNGVDTETIRLPYEESELLQCINNEELPPILVDLLDRSQVNIFYSGCVIVQIRDYRRSSNPITYDCRHVLLKPTTQTLLCDVNLITSDSNKWTPEDKQQLESQLLLATQEPLCLNPSGSVVLLANRLQYHKNKFNTMAMHRTVKKFSQASINRKRKFENCAAPLELRLHDYLIKRKDCNRNPTPVSLKLGKLNVDQWKEYNVALVNPEALEVEKYVKINDRPKTPEDNSPEVVEEYKFESEQSQGKIAYTHLTIKRLPVEESFLGELYIDKDFVEGQEKGATYRFSFGSRDLVDRYIQQFTEIVTEEGRKSVKITHLLPGHPPEVTNSQTNQELSLLLPLMPNTPTSSPGPLPKQSGTNRSGATASSASLKNPQLQISTPVSLAVTHTSSARTASWQVPIAPPVSTQASNASPGHPSVTSPGSLPSYSQAAIQATSKSTPTPPPNARTPTPNSSVPSLALTPPPQSTPPGSRRPSITEGLATGTATSANVGPLGLISGVPLGLASIITGSGEHTSNLASSMSLAGMSMPPGIAVPISLAMMHPTQTSLNSHAPSSVIVSSIPGLLSASGLSSTASQASNAGSLGTTVAPSPASVAPPTVIVTSAMLTSPPPVLATPTSMLPLSIGMNQLMASSLKGSSQGLCAATASGSPLSLLQVSGSLFSQLHRSTQSGQVKATGSQQHSIAPSPPIQSGVAPSTVASVTTPLLATILPQQQTILAYQKQSSQQPNTQQWSQSTSSQSTKCKNRKRSTPSPRDQQGNRSRDSTNKPK